MKKLLLFFLISIFIIAGCGEEKVENVNIDNIIENSNNDIIVSQDQIDKIKDEVDSELDKGKHPEFFLDTAESIELDNSNLLNDYYSININHFVDTEVDKKAQLFSQTAGKGMAFTIVEKVSKQTSNDESMQAADYYVKELENKGFTVVDRTDIRPYYVLARKGYEEYITIKTIGSTSELNIDVYYSKFTTPDLKNVLFTYSDGGLIDINCDVSSDFKNICTVKGLTSRKLKTAFNSLKALLEDHGWSITNNQTEGDAYSLEAYISEESMLLQNDSYYNVSVSGTVDDSYREFMIKYYIPIKK